MCLVPNLVVFSREHINPIWELLGNRKVDGHGLSLSGVFVRTKEHPANKPKILCTSKHKMVARVFFKMFLLFIKYFDDEHIIVSQDNRIRNWPLDISNSTQWTLSNMYQHKGHLVTCKFKVKC